MCLRDQTLSHVIVFGYYSYIIEPRLSGEKYSLYILEAMNMLELIKHALIHLLN